MRKGILYLLVAGNAVYAGSPVWTFTPLTATSISVPSNGAGVVQYTVTNQSKKSHTLVMNTIPGITQDTSGVNCKNPFTLGYQQSCTLKLNIIGNQLTGNVNGGPVVCEQASQGLQCYQPIKANQLNITLSSSSQYSVGGNISNLSLSSPVSLQINNSAPQQFSVSGPYTFSNQLNNGQAYNVTVSAQPSGQTCTVTNSSGTITGSNVTNVNVTCAANAYTLGGTVSGLSGTVVLLNNGGDSESISANGGFTFTTPVAQGAAYNVTVGTQPSGQTCTVSNGTGTMGSSNINNISVTCVNATPLLSLSSSNVALSVTGLTEYGITPTTSGLPRTITITNTGSATATNVTYTLSPSLPAGSSISPASCGSIGVGSTCVLTITPGATPSAPVGNTTPTPIVLTVSGTNTNTVTSNINILSYGSYYQGGYVYAFNDSISSNLNVGGKVMTISDQGAANSVIWSSNGTGGASANVAYDAIYGVSRSSTTASPAPSAGQVTGQTACNGAIDGLCNTNNIYVYYQNNATNHPINLTYYAAGLCKQTISGYSDWYLPAICEMGYGLCGSSSSPTLQNMQKSLIDISGLTVLSGLYWSSTQRDMNPDTVSVIQDFSNNFQGSSAKEQLLRVRCSRAF